ncbi:MAG: AraC family transcriptional regulator ligand-binding domain-containing protein [Polyangiales bacterium]
MEVAGVPAAEFRAAAGLAPDRFAQLYAWMDEAEFDRLLELASELTDDPAFGLHWIERSPMNRFDVFAPIATHAPTLRHALDFVLAFQPILSKRTMLEAVERRDSLLLRCTAFGGPELSRRVHAELTMFGILRLVRYAGVPAQAVRQLSFAYAAPSYVREYTRVAPVVPRFERAATELELDSSWLDRPLEAANVELYQVLKSQAQLVLARLQHGSDHASRVRDYLRGALPRIPSMPETARALDTSVRSLRRRLADEGALYSQLVEQAQQVAARQLLADPARPIKQVSYEVGFGSTPSFVRAFKRWTGESPSAFRSARLAGPT